ncbi:ankyrin repeat domain-containing protein [Brachyspira sp.]|uniref:ankyrin repeat domain-containing protein n=1 Tax=Brachyspira sp. TaxID=1977261 RepID=UPI002605CCBD|nr:ankyrin repeat domain-containing protein [Brachyspira sp.]
MSECEHFNVVKNLLENGANLKSKFGKTALTYANQIGHESIVKIFKDACEK